MNPFRGKMCRLKPRLARVSRAHSLSCAGASCEAQRERRRNSVALTGNRTHQYSLLIEMARRGKAVVLLLVLSISVLAGMPLHAEQKCHLPGMADCCAVARQQARTPQ